MLLWVSNHKQFIESLSVFGLRKGLLKQRNNYRIEAINCIFNKTPRTVILAFILERKHVNLIRFLMLQFLAFGAIICGSTRNLKPFYFSIDQYPIAQLQNHIRCSLAKNRFFALNIVEGGHPFPFRCKSGLINAGISFFKRFLMYTCFFSWNN